MRKTYERKITISAVLLIAAAVALASASVGFLARPAQTIYFTQLVTTLSMWTTTNQYPMGNYTITATETWGRVCGNVPWDMGNITAHCGDEPVPEFPAASIIAFVALVGAVFLLRRRCR